MADDLKRIEDKIDGIALRINSIDVTVAKQQISLDDHIRRTEILEHQVEPLKKDMAMIHGALKFIGLFSILVGIVEGILRIIGH